MKIRNPIRLLPFFSLFLCLFAGLVLFAGPSKAAVTGTLQGTVKDAAGEPLKGADITLVGTGLVTVTGKDGSYLFTGVLPGTYTLRVELVTFQTANATVVLQQDNTV